MTNKKIAAVVVTFNRLNLLQECIAALRSQTYPVDIVIINNGSTDGTPEWLSQQTDLNVISQPNAGSSGGQYTGVKYSVENNYDWVWCMDDDTIPTENALKAFVDSEYFVNRTSFLCSVVLWKDHTFHKMNQPMLINGGYEEKYHPGLKSSEIYYCSFVSVMINTAAVRVVGYPLKKMFIWYDDLEYTIRLRKYGPGYLIGNSIVYHKTEKNLGPDFLPKDRKLNSKELMGVRNYLFIRKNIYPFSENKIKHSYIYLKSVLSILKYSILTQQFGNISKEVVKGLFMNNKQTL